MQEKIIKKNLPLAKVIWAKDWLMKRVSKIRQAKYALLFNCEDMIIVVVCKSSLWNRVDLDWEIESEISRSEERKKVNELQVTRCK